MNGIVELVYLENRGVAFGIFENWHLFFVILIPIIIATFLIIIKKVNINSVLFSLSSALIIGGGIGNLIDRIIRGYVIDYIRLSFFSPVCNFADYCISVGTALLIIYILFFHKKSLSKTT
jgi:signal peptidase II